MGVLTALAGLSMACRSEPGEVVTAWPDATPAEWTVLSIFDAPVLAGSRLAIETSAKGVGGYTGCNWYGMRRDTLLRRVEMTGRGCTRPAGVMEQEQRLVSALMKGAMAVRSGDTLQVRDSAGASVLTLLLRRPAAVDLAILRGRVWRLSRSTIPALDSAVTIRFGVDSVSGFGGCRVYSGAYSTTGDRLRLIAVSMAAVECTASDPRRSEEALTTAFTETSHFAVSPEQLTIVTWGGDTLQFTAVPARGDFSSVGLAVRNDNAWCAELPSTARALRQGEEVTLIFADSASADAAVTLDATASPRSGQCHAEVAQSRWADYVAYDLTMGAAHPGVEAPPVVLVAPGRSRWSRLANGRLRGDFDGDGVPEEAYTCAADEGVHLLIESIPPAGGRVRRVHEYFDWGVIVEGTCPPGVGGDRQSALALLEPPPVPRVRRPLLSRPLRPETGFVQRP